MATQLSSLQADAEAPSSCNAEWELACRDQALMCLDSPARLYRLSRSQSSVRDDAILDHETGALRGSDRSRQCDRRKSNAEASRACSCTESW